jgi:hypothetical protein
VTLYLFYLCSTPLAFFLVVAVVVVGLSLIPIALSGSFTFVYFPLVIRSRSFLILPRTRQRNPFPKTAKLK